MKFLTACFAALLFGFAARAQDAWQPRSSGVTNNLWSVAYAANQWVAVGEQGTIITSPDGVTWTSRTSGFPARWLVGVGYGTVNGSGLWVVVGESGLILTSPDAITWTARKTNGTRINAVAYGNGAFVAADDLGSTYFSPDGIGWTGPSFGGRTTFARGLVYGSPNFVITGAAGITTTYDGAFSAVRVSSGSAAQMQGAAYGRNLYLVTGGANTFTSRDAITWTQQPATTTLGVQGATFFNNQFVAVGNGGGIATTFDGTAWSDRASGTTQTLIGVGASPDSAIIVGFGGTVLQSAATRSLPAPTISPASVTEAAGGNVAFTTTVVGATPLSYQWRKNGADISGATSDTLFLPNVQTAQSGSYTCLVTNSAGGVLSSAASLAVVATLPAADPVDSTFTLGPTLNAQPRSGVVQPDGKILVGGSFLLLNEGQAQFGLARLTSSGALDPTFKPGAIDPNGVVQTITVQPDGKILVGGNFATINGVARNRIARYNADGSLDTAFVPAYTPTTAVTQIAVAPDGRILVVNGSNTLTRLNPDGSLDPSWLFSVTAFSSPTLSTVQSVEFQSDRKIVVGAAALTTGVPICTVRRLNEDGTIDASFTSNSLGVTTPFRALRVLADGRIMAAAGPGLSVQRLTTTGQNDPTYTGYFNPSLLVTSAAFTADGRTWLSGTFTTINGVSRNHLARLNSDGSVDSTYSPGTGVFNASGSAIGANFILPLSDDRAILGGDFTRINTTSRTYLARLNAQSLSGANNAVVVDVDGNYREVRAGDSFSVQISASGSAPLLYALALPSNSTISSLTTNTLTVTNVQTSGFYGASATNNAGLSPAVMIYVRVVPSAPFIIAQPPAVQTNTGRQLTLSVTSGGSSSLTYQWFKNGTAIVNATGSTYTIAKATVTDIGDYTVVVRNTLGFATSQTVHVGVDETSRFINLATRGNVGKSDALLIVGFVIQGPGTKRVMLRAVGPTLSQFGVTGVLANPVLTVYNGSGGQIYSNDDWGSSSDVPGVATADTRIGAFPLPAGSLDAAGILTLSPGSYTAIISGKPNGTTETTGIALAEIYEDDTASSARLVNLSSRGVVSPGASVMIPAFVTSTPGTQTPKKLLIRGVGPGLGQFGVTGFLANPTVTVTDSAGVVIATNDDWESNANVNELRTVTSQLAFPLAAGSKDAALLVSLPPAGYTILVSGVANTSGTALVEVYEVP